MKKQRRHYEESFKEMAVELCLSGRRTVDVAEELGVGTSNLNRWKREYTGQKLGFSSGSKVKELSAEQIEIARLKKALREAQLERDILKKAVKHLLQERWQIYGFIKNYRLRFPIEKMCKVLGVSRSGYYYWLKGFPSKRAKENKFLLKEIRSIYYKSRCRYGSPKITKVLRAKGYSASRPRVARLMRKAGLRSKIRRKYKTTTDSKHTMRVSPNLLKRKFKVRTLGKYWVSDITYLRTAQGWLYLTIILDLADRKVLGWALSRDLRTEATVLPAWKMAIKNRVPQPGVIFHSDRGVQYASQAFRELLKKEAVLQSMSRKANCYDNAVAEAFFKILKSELGYDRYFASFQQAKITLFEFIEIWYNRQRIHASIGYRTPVEMEQLLIQKFNQAA